MNHFPEGNAIVYCEEAFNTTNGKTAHGLVRYTERYYILSVIDSVYRGLDAGKVLDNKPTGIPIFSSLEIALEDAAARGKPATHLVIGLAPDGGRLSQPARDDIREAIDFGLNIDCGLHDFLTEDSDLMELAQKKGVVVRDIRKPLSRDQYHFFSGKIEQVDCLKIAVLGTDSAVGKRTTAWMLEQALNNKNHSTVMVGTGQTAWLQGARYCIILDTLVNDFVSGEIEHAVWSAFKDCKPEVILIEGQGSLLNPAYPGGFEILAAGRPDAVILQHAPARKEYDGFPGYPIQSLDHQVKAIEIISGRKVIAITINHEDLNSQEISAICKLISSQTGLPVYDVLLNGANELANLVIKHSKKRFGKTRIVA
ncbi:MAG: DUF1611 domain-containing protein [candidate division Zixibacteria bacterium]|nr:DUF1611 domain-containing protein [candidate division Zixibacteria bacterium]